jgi:GNAT superfamily N-acetyltransferase
MTKANAGPIVVEPLTRERFGDLEALFAQRGCAVARGCWCMYYREGGPTSFDHGRAAVQSRKRALKRLCAAGPPPGLVAYRGGAPVGWVTLGPREDFRRLARSRVMKPLDERPAWSIVCFVVPSAHRRQGVTDALLAAAVDYARAHGATLVEGYPSDRAVRGHADASWFGSKSLFDRAGFEEVARRRPDRPFVRLELAPPARKPAARKPATRKR